MKFKFGDKVIQTNQDYPITKIGWTGTVLAIDEKAATVNFGSDRGEWNVDINDLELVSEVPVVAAKVGIKHDAGKAPISLIPVEAIEEEAQVFAFGAKKYGKHNFRFGMDYSRLVDALMRHALAIIDGEDIDPESGLPHRAHARCCLSMLTYMQRNNVGKDDRFKKENKNV